MPSREHKDIVWEAYIWLRQQGFVDILVETRIIVVGDSAGETTPEGRYLPGVTLKPDVIGYKSTLKVVIECGSIMKPSRLLVFQEMGYEVYVWPYDAKEPYLWSENLGLCRFCGRKFEHSRHIV